MIGKKGALVLRDIMIMMLMISSIFVLASLFIEDMSSNYDNTVMSNEWAASGINLSGNSMFDDTSDNLNETGSNLITEETGLSALISSITQSLEGIGKALFMVLAAPNTIGDMISSTLLAANAPPAVVNVIKWLIIGALWSVVIFSIASAFLRGGRL